MRGLRVTDGDLVVVGGALDEVTGAEKVRQDLRLALIEPLGNDRFHPGWGSRLDEHVGLPLVEATRVDIEQEAGRVVGNYAAVQRDKIQADTSAGVRSRYQTADVVTGIASIRAVTSRTSVQVAVQVRTGDNQSVSITTSGAQGG